MCTAYTLSTKVHRTGFFHVIWLLSCFDLKSLWVRCLQTPLKSSNLAFHSFSAFLYKPGFGDLWSFIFLNCSNLIKVFDLSISMYWSLAWNFLNFCLCGTLEIFYTRRGCVCSYSVFHSLHVKVGLFLEDLLKKKIFVYSQFVFQNDQLMPEGWGLYKNIMKRDCSDTCRGF